MGTAPFWGTGLYGLKVYRKNKRKAATASEFLKIAVEDEPKVVAGAAAVSAATAGAGYKLGGNLASRALAHRHGVSYQIEKISHFYGINVDQYRAILVAAKNKDRDGLRVAVADLFGKRFGAGWQDSMKQYFSEYSHHTNYLMSLDRSALNQKEQTFVRMVELGAAMENLYNKNTPSKKKIVDAAILMYQVLGIL